MGRRKFGKITLMLENKQEPNISIGDFVSSPFACDFVHHCWKHITFPKNSVFELYRGGNKTWELYEQGILKIEDIEDDFPLTHFQHLQRKGLRNQEQYINKEAIKNIISSWQFPLYFFLILRLFFPAIPVLDGTRPYQQVPFQYSLYILEEDGKLSHKEFLAHPEDFLMVKSNEIIG